MVSKQLAGCGLPGSDSPDSGITLNHVEVQGGTMPRGKNHGSGSSSQWGAWSEWTVDEAGYNCRIRQNDDGLRDYYYGEDPGDNPTPRNASTDDAIEEMGRQLTRTQIEQPGLEDVPEEEIEYVHAAPYSIAAVQPQLDYPQATEYAEYDDYDEEEERQVAVALDAHRNHAARRTAGEQSASAYAPSYKAVEPVVKKNLNARNTTKAGFALDSRYKVQPSYRFAVGKIVKIYWSEPKGARKASAVTWFSQPNSKGDLVHASFRRWLIVATYKGSSIGLPIFTYGNQACGKPGVHPEHHGIIHDYRLPPMLQHDEPDLGFGPIRTTMDEEEEVLSGDSRINYAKPATLEHNTYVLFVGSVHEEDMDSVFQNFNSTLPGANGENSQAHKDRRSRGDHKHKDDRHSRKDPKDGKDGKGKGKSRR